MDIKSIKNIVIIGSGNIASSLAIALSELEYEIKQIYSHTLKHAKELAGRVNASYTNRADDLLPDADLYIIAVTDSEIENVLKNIPSVKGIIVHTSGSTPISIFEDYVSNYGVIYPMQTFSKSKIINNFKHIPIFIEAENTQILSLLNDFSHSLSGIVSEINSQQRLALHVGAVFSCNFVNHLLALATDVMDKNGLDKKWLKPLIYETIDKALAAKHPRDVQTGPAIRNDELTLNRHIDFLSDEADKLNIYKILSDSILNFKEE